MTLSNSAWLNSTRSLRAQQSQSILSGRRAPAGKVHDEGLQSPLDLYWPQALHLDPTAGWQVRLAQRVGGLGQLDTSRWAAALSPCCHVHGVAEEGVPPPVQAHDARGDWATVDT